MYENILIRDEVIILKYLEQNQDPLHSSIPHVKNV